MRGRGGCDEGIGTLHGALVCLCVCVCVKGRGIIGVRGVTS